MREGKPRRVAGGWQIRVTDEHGRRRKKTFESHAEAQKALNAERARVTEVRDGKRAPDPRDRRFAELADSWIEAVVPEKRSGDHDLSIIRHHLLPAFGPLLLKELSKARPAPAAAVTPIEAFVTAKSRELSKKTVANILTLFISMLNRAVDPLGWIPHAPKVKKPKVALVEEDFDYLRDDLEVARFLAAAREEGELVHALYATATYNGLRAGELAGLLWENVSLRGRIVTVKFSYDGDQRARRAPPEPRASR